MENMEDITSNAEVASGVFEDAPDTAVVPQKEPPKRRKNDLRRTENILGWVYISPMVVGLLVFTAVPLIMSIMAIFYDWNGVNTLFESKAIGFQNLKMIFGGIESSIYWKSFGNSLLFAIQLPVGMIIGLFLALAMNREMRGVQTFRVLYYLPGVMSVVAVSIVWNNLFRDNGTLNTMLEGMGLSKVKWLNSRGGVVFVVNLFQIWKGVGYTTLMFVAGLQSVSTDQIEAAKIDGANSWTILIKITLPALYSTIFYLFVTGLMGALQMFNEPFLLLADVGGGYGIDHNGMTTVGFVYDKFNAQKLGLASTGAWVLAIFIFIITAIQLYVDRKKQEAE